MFPFLTLVTLNATRSYLRVAVLAQVSLTHLQTSPSRRTSEVEDGLCNRPVVPNTARRLWRQRRFQRFLRNATLINPARFLAAIPRNIDDDLIAEYRNNGAQPSIPELVNIRMVYTLCKEAEADAKDEAEANFLFGCLRGSLIVSYAVNQHSSSI